MINLRVSSYWIISDWRFNDINNESEGWYSLVVRDLKTTTTKKKTWSDIEKKKDLKEFSTNITTP
jgi:hypothetical protein